MTYIPYCIREMEDGEEIINHIFEASRCELIVTIHVNLSEGRCAQLFTVVQFRPCRPCYWHSVLCGNLWQKS